MWLITYCSFCLAGKRIVQEWSSASRNSLTSGLAMPASPRKIEGVFSPGSAPQRAPVLRAIFSNCAHRPLQLTELLEHKERMVSGEPIVAVEDSAFLLAKGRTVGTVHAKHEGLEPCLLIRPVNPKAGETAQGRASLWPTRALMAGSSRRGLLRLHPLDSPQQRVEEEVNTSKEFVVFWKNSSTLFNPNFPDGFVIFAPFIPATVYNSRS